MKAERYLYMKEYRAKNRDKLLAKKKEYYYRDLELTRLKSREYDSRPEVVARRRENYLKNREKALAYGKLYRESHKDQIRIYKIIERMKKERMKDFFFSRYDAETRNRHYKIVLDTMMRALKKKKNQEKLKKKRLSKEQQKLLHLIS